MNLNLTIKVTKLNKNNTKKLVEYLYKPGIIAGKKIINKKLTVYIIEFQDYTRIWVFKKEFTPITSEYK